MSRDRSMPGAVAGVCARRPVAVIVVWLALAAAAVLGGATVGGGFSDDFDLPGSKAAEGMALVSEADGGARWSTAQVVVHNPAGSLTTERAAVDASREALAALPTVGSVGDPFAGPRPSGGDGSTAILSVELKVPARDLSDDDLGQLREALTPATDAGLEVEYAGGLGERIDGDGRGSAEGLGLVAALVVLLIVFRSVLGAVIPVVGALVAVAFGVGVLGLAAGVVDFPTASVALALMVGLGTGIDYGLLLTTRFRQLLIDGCSPRDAVVRAAATSGHAVVVGAVTVAVALLALFASGVPFVGRLGLAAVLTVATSMLAALTLVPAVLGLTGHRIDRLTIGAGRAEPTSTASTATPTWVRYARTVARRPWPFLGAAVVLLAVLSAPIVALDTGPVDEGAATEDHTTRRAYDLVAQGIGAGANGTLVVVLDATGLPDRAAAGWGASVEAALAVEPGVAAATPASRVGDSPIWTITVTPRSAPQEQATADLIGRLGDDVLPAAWEDDWGDPAPTYVTGYTAAHVEFGEILADRLPWIIALVLVASLIVLTAAFRAPVVAVKAAILNLVSIGAAYGVLVAVFQWQWGSQLIGLDRPVPVETYVPMLMFVIVFGLSMDYEVFLLARVRERWLALGDNVRAVEEGLAATARVITAAALIMICVFLGFTSDPDVPVKMLAVGLAVSVAVDASVVRLVLVPAAMAVMGRANWWVPGPRARRPEASGNRQPSGSTLSAATRRMGDPPTTGDHDD